MLDVKVIPSAQLIESARAEMEAAQQSVKDAMLEEYAQAGGAPHEADEYMLGYFTRMVQESMNGGK